MTDAPDDHDEDEVGVAFVNLGDDGSYDDQLPERRRLTCLHLAMNLHGPGEHNPAGSLAQVLTAAQMFEDFLLGTNQKDQPRYDS